MDGTAWQTHGDAPEQGNAIRKIWCLPEDAARCENDSIPPGGGNVLAAERCSWCIVDAVGAGLRTESCIAMRVHGLVQRSMACAHNWPVYRSKKGTRVGATAWQRSGTAYRPRSRPWLDLPCVLAQEVDRYGPLPTLNCQRAVRTCCQPGHNHDEPYCVIPRRTSQSSGYEAAVLGRSSAMEVQYRRPYSRGSTPLCCRDSPPR